jgi:hypothetical protein
VHLHNPCPSISAVRHAADNDARGLPAGIAGVGEGWLCVYLSRGLDGKRAAPRCPGYTLMPN